MSAGARTVPPSRYQSPAEALERIERAGRMVNDLCHGRTRWTMSIPADPERDPDLVISDGLAAARHLAEDMRVVHEMVAKLLGEDPATWPDHGNVPLAIGAGLALLSADTGRTEGRIGQSARIPPKVDDFGSSRQGGGSRGTHESEPS